MKLEPWHSNEDKSRWRIVRTDDYTDIPGQIVHADEATGDCCLIVRDGEAKVLSLGPNGLRIVARRR